MQSWRVQLINLVKTHLRVRPTPRPISSSCACACWCSPTYGTILQILPSSTLKTYIRNRSWCKMGLWQNLPYIQISPYWYIATRLQNTNFHNLYYFVPIVHYSVGGFSMTISTVSWNKCKWGLGWKPCQIWSWWTWHRSARFRLGNPSSSKFIRHSGFPKGQFTNDVS